MKQISKLAGALLLGASAITLSGCASGLSTKVSRFQAMPVPAGQTFYVVPGEGTLAGLEFNRYATLVASQLAAKGYRPAGAPQLANMIVRLDYGVDEGETEHTVDPYARSAYWGGNGIYGSRYGGFYGSRYGGVYGSRYGYDPFYSPYYGRPYYSRYGYAGRRSPFYYGWNDPFWYNSPYAGYGGGYGEPIRSYTTYKSFLEMDIVQRGTNAPLFEGKAQARSQTDELGTLVPNLVEAMFTGFPGRSGETVRITVPARRTR